jgi:hypothetical protein
MFKITRITVRRFSLAEILLMLAMNQVEAKQKIRGNEKSLSEGCPPRAEAA